MLISFIDYLDSTILFKLAVTGFHWLIRELVRLQELGLGISGCCGITFMPKKRSSKYLNTRLSISNITFRSQTPRRKKVSLSTRKSFQFLLAQRPKLLLPCLLEMLKRGMSRNQIDQSRRRVFKNQSIKLDHNDTKKDILWSPNDHSFELGEGGKRVTVTEYFFERYGITLVRFGLFCCQLSRRHTHWTLTYHPIL